MKLLIGNNLIRSVFHAGDKMSHLYLVRQSVHDRKGRNNIEPQERKVRKIVLVELFVIEMGMNETEPSEHLFP